MAIQKIDIKKIIEEEKIRNNTKKSFLNGAMIAITRIPFRVIVYGILFLIIYGFISLILDIIKYIINL